MSDYSNRILNLYELYLESCKEFEREPVPFGKFKRYSDEQMAGLISSEMASRIDKKDWKDAIYVTMQVADMPKPVSTAIRGECDHCHKPVWLSPLMLDKASISAAIICNRCIPDVTGKTHTEIIEEQFNDLEREQ